MYTYRKLKEKYGVFLYNNDLLTSIRYSDDYQILLEALDEGSECDAFFILEYFFQNSQKDYKGLDAEVVIKCAEKNLSDVYKEIINERLKEAVYLKIKDSNNENVLKFLLSNNFFDKYLMTEVIMTSNNNVLHEVIRNDRDCIDIINNIYRTAFLERKYEDILPYINRGYKLDKYYCSLLLEELSIKEIQCFHEKGMFKLQMDQMLFVSIIGNKDDCVAFFIDKGSKLENIINELYVELYFACNGKRLNNVRNLMKYNLDVNANIEFGSSRNKRKESIIDGFMEDLGIYIGDFSNIREIAKLLFENTKQVNKRNNFFRLFISLDDEYIKELYNEGRFNLSGNKLNYEGNIRIYLNKEKLSLLYELDENFGDFLKNNIELITRNSSEELMKYIKSVM